MGRLGKGSGVGAAKTSRAPKFSAILLSSTNFFTTESIDKTDTRVQPTAQFPNIVEFVSANGGRWSVNAPTGGRVNVRSAQPNVCPSSAGATTTVTAETQTGHHASSGPGSVLRVNKSLDLTILLLQLRFADGASTPITRHRRHLNIPKSFQVHHSGHPLRSSATAGVPWSVVSFDSLLPYLPSPCSTLTTPCSPHDTTHQVGLHPHRD